MTLVTDGARGFGDAQASTETRTTHAAGGTAPVVTLENPMNTETIVTTTRVVCPHCDAINRVPQDRMTESPSCGACKRPLFEGHPVALTESNFNHHLKNSDLPLVVDFWAAWCAPCRAMAPVFERVAGELEPQARFVKIEPTRISRWRGTSPSAAFPHSQFSGTASKSRARQGSWMRRASRPGCARNSRDRGDQAVGAARGGSRGSCWLRQC